MAKKVSFKTPNRAGELVTVYGQLAEVTDDHPTPQVRVWTKHANYGFYNLDRLPGGTLTTAGFKALMTGSNDD